jgi:uncharacterized protein
MPEFEAPVTNQFCWVELRSKDLAGSRAFYGSLFGWTFQELPLPGGSYTVIKTGDKQVGGLMPHPPSRTGAPAGWFSYVAVEDVPLSTGAAVRLGGTIVQEPTGLGPGIFSAVADPTGGVILLWRTPQPIGTFLYGEPGSLSWNELASTNADLAQRFYTQLFGWKAEPTPMPGMMYTVFKSGDTPVAGLFPQPPHMTGAHSAWVAYFAVTDADITFAAATRLGAKVLMPLSDIPEVGRFGWLQDPQGATFAVIKNARG